MCVLPQLVFPQENYILIIYRIILIDFLNNFNYTK